MVRPKVKAKRFGWKPDLPDFRDHKFTVAEGVDVSTLPASVDLRPGCPGVYDQGDLGSCTANAIAAALEFDRKKQKLPDWIPSRLFIYYQERKIEGSIPQDAGAEIRDGIKSVNVDGAPHENLWPYNIAKFAQKPALPAYTDAKLHKSVSYKRVDNTNLNQFKACLAGGTPIVIGFTVYDSFMGAPNGDAPMPGPTESVQGGHAILIVGYDDKTQRFTLRNSWGPSWGNKGYGTLPYAYLTDSNLADDAWTITIVK